MQVFCLKEVAFYLLLGRMVDNEKYTYSSIISQKIFCVNLFDKKILENFSFFFVWGIVLPVQKKFFRSVYFPKAGFYSALYNINIVAHARERRKLRGFADDTKEERRPKTTRRK